MDMRLELVAVPVSDVDLAEAFYVDRVGFVADHDHRVDEDTRFVQLTPPGSACSIWIGTGVAEQAAPGTLRGLQLVVDDVDAVRRTLEEQGVAVSEIDEQAWGTFVYSPIPTATSGRCSNCRSGEGACAYRLIPSGSVTAQSDGDGATDLMESVVVDGAEALRQAAL